MVYHPPFQEFTVTPHLISVLAMILAPVADTKITPVAVKDLPPSVITVIKSAAPAMTIKAAELKERETRRYFDVEGVMPDGSEIEFDLLEKDGAWMIVETQRTSPGATRPSQCERPPQRRARRSRQYGSSRVNRTTAR